MIARNKARWIARGLFVVLALVAVVALSGGLGTRSPLRSMPSAAAATVAPPATGVERTTPAAANLASGGTTVGRTGPDVVTVGLYILDIQGIDLQLHRYQLDFYVWFRWTNPDIDPSRTIEFMNGSEQWATMRTPSSDGPVLLADGSHYSREHVQSMFNTNMPLEDYPFDRLTLEIVMEDVDATTDEVIYVLDDPAVASAPDLSVPGYLIGRPTAEVRDWAYPALGETGIGPTSASRIVFSIPVTRPWLPYTVKIFVPLLVVLLCASIIFLISPEHVDARFGLGISALLTLIALKWTTDSEMPLVDYLGLVDSIYIIAFVYIAIGLADTTYTTWRRGQGIDDTVLQRFDRRIFVIASTMLVVGSAAVFFGFSR